MLAKLTARNQLTISEQAFAAFPDVEGFEVAVEGGRIVLTPLKGSADAVRRKLENLGITEDDVADAITWARRRR